MTEILLFVFQVSNMNEFRNLINDSVFIHFLVNALLYHFGRFHSKKLLSISVM